MNIAIGIFAGLACLAVMSAVTSALVKRYPSLQFNGLANRIFSLFSKSPLLHKVWKAFWGVVVVVVAPILEELLFRGIIDAKLNEAFGQKSTCKKVVRLALVALFFGVAHLSLLQNRATNVAVFLATSAIGVVLGIVKEFSGNLLAPMSAHAVYNLGVLL